ncbi:alpha/beta hydrolase [Algoriphagus sp. PAP.12]|uniref:alpha/beta hydrolase n=1 Tax=Algoriphagus sp. PAP.12 TaxID=2996678 RepID=UPI00227BAF38|nr:alpha/beta hydrolase [Algoriphagus sp. PAP.12]
MKKSLLSCLIILLVAFSSRSQTNKIMHLFPEGTTLHGNIPYFQDTLKKHLLDIYLPPKANEKTPLIIWMHGGGWLQNDKYAAFGYLKETVSEIINHGYAIASIDYRFSTQAVFPAQMQDCNAAISYLFENAEKYNFDTDRFIVMGFSAGGHLAALLGLSKNNQVDKFFFSNSNKGFKFRGVVDYYGPADLTLFPGADDPKSPEGLLIGAAPLDRPDLAKMASPVSFVDEKDPPFIIIHGEKDDQVSPRQSHLLNSWLKVSKVPTELHIVPGAPHFGPMFDASEVRKKVIGFMETHLK